MYIQMWNSIDFKLSSGGSLALWLYNIHNYSDVEHVDYTLRVYTPIHPPPKIKNPKHDHTHASASLDHRQTSL